MLKYEKNERMYSDLLGHILGFEFVRCCDSFMV